MPPTAGETMAVISSFTSFFTFSANALHSLAVRLASDRKPHLAAHLIARHDAAHRRRDDGGDLVLHFLLHFFGQCLAQLGGALGVRSEAPSGGPSHSPARCRPPPARRWR